MTIVLRQDQQEITNACYQAWDNKQNFLGVAVTGFGKSVCMSGIVRDVDQRQAWQSVIAHRRELIGQMSVHVARRGVQHRIVGPREIVTEITQEHYKEFGRSFINPSARCAVASIDTLMARADDADTIEWGKNQQFVQIDEGHHVLKKNKWGKGFGLFPHARLAGWSASPARADGYGLGSHADGLYDAMFVSTPMRELINRGDLCDYDIVIPESDFYIDDDRVGSDGDFTLPAMKEASEKSQIVGDVVQTYCKYAFGKRAIAFATDVETSNKMAAKFMTYGIPAVSVSAKTPGIVRNEYIRRFRRGEIWVLVNVDLFGEGFDLPAVEVVIMARPTASLAVYLQQFGRALRTMPGKLKGMVIDHVSNYKRHNLPDIPRFWTLDRREKKGKKKPNAEIIELRRCDECSRPYEKVKTCCPHCGAVPKAVEGGARTVEQVDGDMRLLAPDVMEAMRKAAQLQSPHQTASQAAWVTGNKYAGQAALNKAIDRHAAQNRLKEAVAWWIGGQRSRGRPDAESEKRFYLTLGMTTLEAYALPRDEMEKIATIIEEWNAGVAA